MTVVTISNNGPGPAEINGEVLVVGGHKQFDLDANGLVVTDPMLLPETPAPAQDPIDLNASNPGGGS